MRTHRFIPVLLGLAVLSAACGGEEGGGPADNGQIAAQAGDGQSDTVTKTLLPYQVVVTDLQGDPKVGVTVNWTVLSGGGSVTSTGTTNANGIASATATLGQVSGVQTVTATAPGYTGSPVSFASSATPDTPAAIQAVAGNAQSANTSQALPVPIQVRVLDQFDNRIPGLPVNWAVTAGGAALSAANSVTDQAGVASVVVTMPAVATAVAVEAMVTGLPQSVAFTATSTWGAQLIATVNVPENYGIHDTFVRDGVAFVFAWNTGVILYDVGNGISGGSPSNPVEISRIQTVGGQAHNGWWFHNPNTMEKRYLFVGEEGPGAVGSSSSGDIHVVDVSNLAQPTEVATFTLPGAGVHNFWMDEQSEILYAAFYNGGVVVLDVSGTLSGVLPQTRVTANVKPGGNGNTYIWGVQLFNGSLYASDMLSGFWRLDPSTLATIAGGSNVSERYTSDLWVAGSYGYSGSWGFRGVQGNAVKIWNIAAGGVTLADSLVISGIGTISDLEVTANGKVLAVSAEGGGQAGVHFFSLTDPENPVFLAKALSGQGVHTQALGYINGRVYAFGARNPSGAALLIYDITDLAQ